MAPEDSSMGEPVGLFLLRRAAVVFSELTLETPVCPLGGKWIGKGEEDMEINRIFPERQNNMENGTQEESNSLVCPD